MRRGPHSHRFSSKWNQSRHSPFSALAGAGPRGRLVVMGGRGDTAESLFALTDRLFRANSLDDVYGAALDAICGLLECERASILLFRPARRDELCLVARAVGRVP